jgi:hypothetical protein
VVEASRNQTSTVVAHLTLVANEPTTETASAEAGAHRLLAAVAELQLREDAECDQLSKRRRGTHRGREYASPRKAAERGLHRYCSGCSRETEHVLCHDADGPIIPTIRWPAARAASGTTICVDCGQWRTAASQLTQPIGVSRRER